MRGSLSGAAVPVSCGCRAELSTAEPRRVATQREMSDTLPAGSGARPTVGATTSCAWGLEGSGSPLVGSFAAREHLVRLEGDPGSDSVERPSPGMPCSYAGCRAASSAALCWRRQLAKSRL